MNKIIKLVESILFFAILVMEVCAAGIKISLLPIIAIPYIYANEIDKHRSKQ